MARPRLKVKRAGAAKQPRPQLREVAGIPVVKGADIALDFKSMGLLDGVAEGTRHVGGEENHGDRKPRGSFVGYSDIATDAVSREMTSDRALRAAYAQALGEWLSSGREGLGAPAMLFGPDPETGVDAVDGSYLQRVDFPRWFKGLSRESRGLRLITTAQAVVDCVLELSGFFDENHVRLSLALVGDSGDPYLLDAFTDATDVLYKNLGFLSVRKADQGSLTLDIDVAGLFAAFQTLCAYALSACGCNHEFAAIARSLDHALVDAVAKANTAEGRLKVADEKARQVRAALEGRPTRKELEQATRRIAELEAEVSELGLLHKKRTSEAAGDSETPHPSVLAARAEAQIEALARSQAASERRALDAESALDVAYRKLDEAERRNSEAERVYSAEVRSLKLALAAAGEAKGDGPVSGLLASAVPELPQTAPEVLDLAARAFSDKLVVIDSAYSSAKDYKGDPFEIWTLMRALAIDGYDLFLGEGGFDVRSEFRSRTGIELSTTEPSLNTKEDRRAWEVDYNGKTHSLRNHIKGSKRKSFDSLRIHFAVDRDDRVLIVAHCGGHLPSGGTCRRSW